MPKTVDKPRPVPLPTGLVVKNGSKIRLRILRIHAESGIGERQDRRSPRRVVRDPSGVGARWMVSRDVVMDNASAVGHGIARVDRQIHRNLFHHAGIGIDGRDA